MNAPIGVKVESLSKRYAHRVKGEVYAARDVTLDVKPGEFLTLLGPSGCGKTTTLRMIAGFETPDGGRVLFGGDDVTHRPANERNIGFVFQNYALFPHLSVAENVAYGLEVRNVAGTEIATRVSEVLALVGLEGYEHQFSSQLSGGEQQRVALARAIVIRPRLLLFDEPLSNLDAKLRVQMREEIRALQRRLGITTIYVTHDQEEAMAVSDRIVVMSGGRVKAEGSASDLYHHPRSEFVARFIGRVNVLAAKVIEAGDGRARVEAAGAVLEVSSASALDTGADVRLVVRPEAVEILREPGAQAHWQAVVAERVFLGEKIEYRMQLATESLVVIRYNAGAKDLIEPGATVGLRILEGTASILSKDAP